MQYDRDFLLQLDRLRNKTIYARIIKLTFNEEPIELIEGKVTGGSISIDGASAIRRTCSLSLLSEGFKQANFYCELNTKFKLEIGVENSINSNYPSIIWFKQGVFVVTSFSSSRTANNFTLSLSGKDKMCLLNGEVGGALESLVDFGQIEEEDIFGVWTKKNIQIKDIIRNAVHVYGREPYHNIIIKDLEDYGAQLLEYRYDTPLYLYRKPNSETYLNACFSNENTKYYYQNASKEWVTTPKALNDIPETAFESLNNLALTDSAKFKTNLDDEDEKAYCFTKIKYGEACGYKVTELTYPGDLIAKPGESLTSVLDKIKNILVEFEYFYNVDGQFVFQKKPSTLSVMQNLNPEKNDEIISTLISNDNLYIFNNGENLTNLNNNPNLLNLRNDYSIWGEKTTPSGVVVPIHLRYAIDKKPTKYVTIEVEDGENSAVSNYAKKHNIIVTGQSSIEYIAGSEWKSEYKEIALTKSTYEKNMYYYKKGDNYILDDEGYKKGRKYYIVYRRTCDWREVLYRMAADYYKYNFLDDFNDRVGKKNAKLYPLGITGYENYYIDIYSFWRDLYNPLVDEEKRLKNFLKEAKEQQESLETSISGDEVGSLAYNTKLSQINYLKEKQVNLEAKLVELDADKDNYYSETETEYPARRCWNKYVFTQPYSLNFWFDLLDTHGILSQYNVQKIGPRQKVVNEKLQAISYNKIPNIIYYKALDDISYKNGYKYIQISEQYDNMFSVSSQGKSLQERLNELINTHSFCAESVSITALPIYYLEPNSRIQVIDGETGLNTVYSVDKISLPLTYNGTMSISGSKIYETIID